MEFHVSREARDRFGFDGALFSLTGNVVLPDFRATRDLARKMNAAYDIAAHPELAVQPGQLNAMGLIDEILHYVSALYRQQRDPRALEAALASLDTRLGAETVDATLLAFVERYPPSAVYRGDLDARTWLSGTTDGQPNRQVALEELAHLWLANVNPAFAPFAELFDDAPLARDSAYPDMIDALGAFFAGQPPFGPENQDLVAMLRSPAIVSPDSLAGQLRYIHERWGLLLEGSFGGRLALTLDVLAEDERALWLRFHGAGDIRRGDMPDFTGQELEPERFSMDRDWMPRLVLLARSTYVWLDQLAKQYQREVRRLDQVPDEELDRLARWGFTGLWLIGLWERSRASERIKKLRGNPDAVASAYSLLDYRIAQDLGGEAAYENLRERAWRRGIRLASDMVPNHMGIDSTWVMEHPDWFISLDQPPYPAYSFGGPDLSPDPRVGIWIEDHYYDNTDASVVFRREDRATGENRFVYHGNDGTSMPWNDTAQLDYLKPEVREAVIQTILAVARRFHVIRFDAAMTLAKKHYQRLWFPEPGTGGAIPSRAEHGMSRREFDAAMPVEFWREVVDRVAAETPDTLLLAEAFWLMEGYFVRTLGMHRVYNSAFMNMLRDEENANYRSVMKNTLEFDPEILKRYVNFMNNPDERTAIDQFGTGDKYFGIATLMVTLPGLPMFGHGQVEGYAEKYGMEFRRAYWDERPNEWLVARHEREIFPLLHRRHLFAEVRDFLLYDLVDPSGNVNEDVFAYSNRSGGERTLVVYHNRYAEARGWIRQSVGYAVKGAGDERTIVRRTLGEGLGLTNDDRHYCAFRDQRTGLEYLRPSRELCERGMYVELGAYQCHVFVDVRELRDDVGLYGELAGQLNGRGVPSLDAALRELVLRPVTDPIRALVSGDMLRRLLAARRDAAEVGLMPTFEAVLDEVEGRLRASLEGAARVTGGISDPVSIAREARDGLAVVLGLPGLGGDHKETATGGPAKGTATAPAATYATVRDRLRDEFPDDLPTWSTLLVWALLRPLGRVAGDDGAGLRSRAWLDAWNLAAAVATGLRDVGLDGPAVGRVLDTLRVVLALPDPATLSALTAGENADLAVEGARLVQSWLADLATAQYMGVNTYGGVTWFDRDGFARLVRWSFLLDAVELRVLLPSDAGFRAAATAAARVAGDLDRASRESGYQVDRLLALAVG
ncbi:MAG: alpha-amylase family glycosyl hydrolase [Candidatus Limnocylindrales bacterium]